MSQVFNGLITRRVHFVCPDCGTQLTREISLPPDMFVFQDGDRLLCTPCGTSRRQAEQRKAEVEALQKQINATGIPPQFRAFDHDRGNIAMLNWITGNLEKNLLMISEVDTGKTRSMCKALLDANKRGLRCLYLDFVEFASQYSAAKKESTAAAQKVLKRILGNYDIVLLDDLDKNKLTDTTGDLLYKLFNALYSGTAKARVWATMNHSGSELMRKFENADLGAAVVSRIERMMKDDRFAVRKF